MQTFRSAGRPEGLHYIRLVRNAPSPTTRITPADVVASHSARDRAGRIVSSIVAYAPLPFAAAAILEAIDRDPDTDIRKRAVFALSQLPKDESIPKLIEVAKNNKNAAVRQQAMFWLGQSNDPRALKFFEDVLLK